MRRVMGLPDVGLCPPVKPFGLFEILKVVYPKANEQDIVGGEFCVKGMDIYGH